MQDESPWVNGVDPPELMYARGDKSGSDTLLRTHWTNQSTGLVNDEVFRLRMELIFWDELLLS